MTIKSFDKLITEPYIVTGEFKDVNQVADYMANSPHSILLDGYLLYAYKGGGSIKSLVITTYPKAYGKLMISIYYDGYKMIHCGMEMKGVSHLIEDLSSDKKLADLCKTLKDRFYEES